MRVYTFSTVIRKSLAPASIMVLAVLVLSACGQAAQEAKSGTDRTEPTAATGVIRIGMDEFLFKPDVIRLREGQQVTIELVNQGKIEHEFVVGREVVKERGIAADFQQGLLQGVDVKYTGEKSKLEATEHSRNLHVHTDPKGKGTLTFTVPAGTKGEWEFACFIPGHYEAGMKARLIVE